MTTTVHCLDLLAAFQADQALPTDPAGAPSRRGGHHDPKETCTMLKRFVIERNIPGAGALTPPQLSDAATTSNGVLSTLSGVQWQHSYVTKDGTFCIYLAEDEAVIREHARLSGFPATRITEVSGMIDPTTAQNSTAKAAA